MQNVNINSEIGFLEGVIIHTPGPEVEKMTPQNVERALYSDILNLSVATDEYKQFKSVLQKQCKVYEVKQLLSDVIKNEEVKKELIDNICQTEAVPHLSDVLMEQNSDITACQLIEGVDLIRDNLTRYLSNERYSLRPLHNFLFTRDASISIGNKVLIGSMASNVRQRETIIMNTIFTHHQLLKTQTFGAKDLQNIKHQQKIKIEGGDVLVVKPNVLVIGTGVRTSSMGIDFIIESIKKQTKSKFHVIVQELPETPESFIHLDMVFTMLDHDTCMVYEPLILHHNRYRTIHIIVDNGNVSSIKTEPGLLDAVKKAGIDLKPIKCGGNDEWHQEREQWHSGANFLALKPGVVIGYERNTYTADAMYKYGFEIIKAADIINGTKQIPEKKALITIAGAELARGGGGARCMSMPVNRIS
jgi:arginine deiminase